MRRPVRTPLRAARGRQSRTRWARALAIILTLCVAVGLSLGPLPLRSASGPTTARADSMDTGATTPIAGATTPVPGPPIVVQNTPIVVPIDTVTGTIPISGGINLCGGPECTAIGGGNGNAPPALLNASQLYQGLYAATPAQAQSLQNLQQAAITATIQEHDLAPGDATAVQSWGRDDAEAELWALLVQAIQTASASRTTDQQNAVDWLQDVVRRNKVQAADAAGLEYVKWDGLDQTRYQQLLDSNAGEGDLQSFLYGGPTGYTAAGACSFSSPPGSQDVYQLPPSCRIPCATCVIFPPSYDQFVQWGTALADYATFNANGLGSAEQSIGKDIAASALAVTIGVRFANAGFALALAASAADTLGPIAATISAALGPVGVVLFVIAAIADGVMASINLANGLGLADKLAILITGARTTPDLVAMLKDSSQTQSLFALFVGATLPTPKSETCDNSLLPPSGVDNIAAPCLNAPAAPDAAAGDPIFAIQQKGATGTSYAPSLTWTDSATHVTTTARLHETWFIDRVTNADGTTAVTQTLRMQYTDWSGQEQTAWLFGDPANGYKFLSIVDQSASGTPVNPSPCIADQTCAYTSTIDYVGTDGKDYAVSVDAAIASAVTWPAPAAITYGAALGAAQLDATATDPSGASVAGTFAYRVDGAPVTAGDHKVLPAGARTLTVQFTPSDTTRYTTPTPVSVSLTVKPAPLTITANAKSMTYGDALPAFDASYSGFVNGDTSSVVSGLACGATAAGGQALGSGAAAGLYTITCGSGTAANYSLSYVTGALTIKPAPLTITADDQSKVYGAADPTFTASYSGFVNGDTPSAIAGLALNGAPSTSGVGRYPIVPSGATNPNYTITFVNGTETITPAPLTITADNQTTPYGQVPKGAWTGSGWVNGDADSTLSAAPNSAPACSASVNGAAESATSAPGIYPGAITCSGAVDPDYSISYKSGQLTIDPLISLDEQGLPDSVPHQATLDGQTVPLPDLNVEVPYNSSHSYSFPASVTDSPSGTVYFTTDQGFSGNVTANLTDTAVYQTMAQVVSADLSAGGIDNGGIGNSLTQQFAAVQADIAAGNTAQALTDLQSFAAHVRAQSGQHITAATAQALLADAQLVYAHLGGTGPV